MSHQPDRAKTYATLLEIVSRFHGPYDRDDAALIAALDSAVAAMQPRPPLPPVARSPRITGVIPQVPAGVVITQPSSEEREAELGQCIREIRAIKRLEEALAARRKIVEGAATALDYALNS